MSEPSKADWARLYQAAITFKQVAPWNWMESEELFAIENPYDAEMAYCSILGAGGREFGLGIFLGERGYHTYMKVISEDVDPDNPDDLEEMIMAPSLSMLLVDRNTLQEEDYEVIRSLGLRFRGKNAWPLFRSQWPGYVPWFLEKGEARFLTAALGQALIVADEIHRGAVGWVAGGKNFVLTRSYHNGRWFEEWRKAPRLAPKREKPGNAIDAVKEVELYLFANQASRVHQTWELDISVLPVPIASEFKRSYFPICVLAVDRNLGLVIGVNLTKPWLSTAEKQDEVIRILRKVNQVPSEIRVKSEKVRRIVEPIAGILDVRLQLGSLPMLEQAKASLHRHLSSRFVLK